ncbi:uncharacterized protein PFLUO_LOCUS5409 [Penicillium psychrofluorescens]|uniref:uncharacterized protein n=1 Tax=Penicillium psychrofluorescens TaxID=3158075 RepID=UPI003CCCF57E
MKPPSGLAPPVPSAANRVRSNSEGVSGTDGAADSPAASQLAGIFAGGMPKLRSRGGVATGATRDSPYMSDSESARRAPAAPAPKPPTAPRPPGARPPLPPPSTESSTQPINPLVASLKKAPPRPVSTASSKTAPPEAPPPRAPPPPPASRKPSAPPPPPPSVSPAAPPPPPPSAAPRAPPPPPSGAPPSVAAQAARTALGHTSSSPAAPPPPPPASAPAVPPPPPPTSPPIVPPSEPPARPSPVSARPASHEFHSALDPSAYTLTNGAGSSPTRSSRSPSVHGNVRVEDNRFKFQGDGLLPKPRPFIGGARRYRAGRGSSVPLDLSALSG